MNNIKTTYIKITDSYLYIYSNKRIERLDNLYIKNGKVDNIEKFISYLKDILNKNILKKKYIFIVDTLLCNSDLFVYNYVFESIGLINYKIINDLDIISNIIDDDNIIVMNWSSSINYAYKLDNQINLYPFNSKIINTLKKKYILLIGDTPISTRVELPVYESEFKDLVIFNYI